MSKRFPFVDNNKPNKNDVVLIYATDRENKNRGAFHAGVVLGYDNNEYTDEHEEMITVSMFINDKETDSSIRTQDIVWWTPMPLTKQELYSGKSTIE